MWGLPRNGPGLPFGEHGSSSPGDTAWCSSRYLDATGPPSMVELPAVAHEDDERLDALLDAPAGEGPARGDGQNSLARRIRHGRPSGSSTRR
jgi:hypothetical protein